MNRPRSSLFNRPPVIWMALTMICACAIGLRSDSLRSDETPAANGRRSKLWDINSRDRERESHATNNDDPRRQTAAPQRATRRPTLIEILLQEWQYPPEYPGSAKRSAKYVHRPPGRTSIVDARPAQASLDVARPETTFVVNEHPGTTNFVDEQPGMLDMIIAPAERTGVVFSPAERTGVAEVRPGKASIDDQAPAAAIAVDEKPGRSFVVDPGFPTSASADQESGRPALSEAPTDSAAAPTSPASALTSRDAVADKATDRPPGSVSPEFMIPRINTPEPSDSPVLAAKSDQRDPPQAEWRPYDSSDAKRPGPSQAASRDDLPDVGTGRHASNRPRETLSTAMVPDDSRSRSNPIHTASERQSSWKPTNTKRRGDAAAKHDALIEDRRRETPHPAARYEDSHVPTVNGTESGTTVGNERTTASRRCPFAHSDAIGAAGTRDSASNRPTEEGWVAATDPVPKDEQFQSGDATPESAQAQARIVTPHAATDAADDGFASGRAPLPTALFRPTRSAPEHESPPAQPWRLTRVDTTPSLPKRSGKPHPLWERLGGPAVPLAALHADSTKPLPSLGEGAILVLHHSSPDGSERRANRFENRNIASPRRIESLRMDIAPIAGVPRIQSPRRVSFAMQNASPEIRSPRRITSATHDASPAVRSPRKATFVMRNASPEIRSPRRTSFVMRDASPRIRSPRNHTDIQTVNSEPTPAHLPNAIEASDDIAASQQPPVDSSDEALTEQQPAAGLEEDQKLGEAPEDTSLRFLRQETVLLDPGEHQFDVSIQYLNDKFDFVVVREQDGSVQVAEAERRQRLLIVPMQLRFGIGKYTQAFVGTAFGWANSETSFLGTDQATSSGGIGDVSAGIVKQIIVGNEYYPDVLATLAFSAPTGDSDFVTALDTPGSNLGEGFWSTTAALTFIQSYDPLVFFYGTGFRYRFQEKFNDVFKVDPGYQAFYRLGVGFAVNPNVTLSAEFNGSFISELEVNGEDVGGSAQEPMQLRLAATINKRRPAKTHSSLKVVEPFVTFGLNDDAVDTVVGITWTY